ncbi:hypothetical protein INR76_04840 [Marixanthomonas sp. SCSIO 43207]|nr:hypothetical protein [Marixanthomonas sp. SCSIO 43207]UAB82603.1 hypothetical protein INR76_04840 [Marixanthomonas sp. SCSIO 43207]
MAIIMIIGYFAAKWFSHPEIETLSFYTALLIGIPYLLIKSNSKKYKIEK